MGSGKSKSTPSLGDRNDKRAISIDESVETHGIRIALNVYKLQGTKPGHRGLKDRIGLGIYHSGIEVYGKEWSFGGQAGCVPGLCGIFACPPRKALPLFLESIQLGVLPLGTPEESIYAILQEMRPQWDSCSYHLFQHNCNHFTQAFRDAISAKFPHLKIKHIPSFINRAARVADVFVPNALYRSMFRRSVLNAPQRPTGNAARDSVLDEGVVTSIPIPSNVKALQAMSVRELKTMMWMNGISWEGCIEKGDLIRAIQESKSASSTISRNKA